MLKNLGRYTTTGSMNSRRFEERADSPGIMSGFGGGGGGVSTSGTLTAKNTEQPMLEGIINYLDQRVVVLLYEHSNLLD